AADLPWPGHREARLVRGGEPADAADSDPRSDLVRFLPAPVPRGGPRGGRNLWRLDAVLLRRSGGRRVGAPLTVLLRGASLRTGERRPPDPRQARSIEKRRKLLEAGRELFARRGYAEVSIGEIAAKAGVAAGGFYLHFSSKKQFLVVLMEAF